MSLSATLIVRDDADRLDVCLRSLEAFVDEIVVVDNGSSDDSVAVAEVHGARVASEPWTGDLAASRNRALALATGEWVLQIDADELLDVEHDGARRALASAGATVAYSVWCVPQPGRTALREHRLWRNRSDVRFHGRVHETILPALDAVDPDHDRRGALDGVVIRRTGGAAAARARRAREEPLLVAELGRDPDRPALSAHLARVLADAGDPERALDAWRRGIAHARSSQRGDPDDRLLYAELVHQLLLSGVVDDELEGLVRDARDRFPPTPSIELAAARLAFATGRPRDALEPLEWLLALDDEAVAASGSSYDERVFGEWAWSLMGYCRFALGDDDAAADAFGRAQQLAPDDASYAVRRRLAEARASTRAS